jgi:hypothetical protein
MSPRRLVVTSWRASWRLPAAVNDGCCSSALRRCARGFGRRFGGDARRLGSAVVDVSTPVDRRRDLDDVAAAAGAGGLQVAGEGGEHRSPLEDRGAGAQHLAVERVGEAQHQPAVVLARGDELRGLQRREVGGVGHAGQLGRAARLGEGQVHEGLVQVLGHVREAAPHQSMSGRAQGDVGEDGAVGAVDEQPCLLGAEQHFTDEQRIAPRGCPQALVAGGVERAAEHRFGGNGSVGLLEWGDLQPAQLAAVPQVDDLAGGDAARRRVATIAAARPPSGG